MLFLGQTGGMADRKEKKGESVSNLLFLIFFVTANAQPGSNVHSTFALIKQKK